jgi:putative peptidoglycan lipid II flippase
VIKATLWITLAHLLGKIFGLIQSRVFGGVYGFGPELDAFVIAFEGVLWTFFLIGEESLGPAVLPVFMDAREKDGDARAWKFISSLMTVQFVLLLIVVGVLYTYPSQVIELLTRSDSALSAEAQAQSALRGELAVKFLGAMAPALLGLSISSLTYMILNGYKEFFWPAFADAALKMALVFGVLIGHALGMKADALIVGALAAGGAKLAVHLFALGRRVTLFKPRIDLSDPYVRRFLMLVAPLLVGIVFAKVRDYFNNIYILSSLEAGLLSINSAGRKIFNTIGALVPYPLSIAMFPFLCEMVARDDRQAMGDFLSRASRMLLMFFIPLAAVIFVLSAPLGQLVFETGRVDASAAALVGRVNAFYCMVLPFSALEFIFMQAYFSSQRMISVTLIGIVFSTLTMAISYVGVVVYGIVGADAVIVVALSYTISRALKTVTLITLLKLRGLPVLPLGSTLLFLLRVAVLGVACGATAWSALKVVERVLPEAAVVQTAEAETSPEKSALDSKETVATEKESAAPKKQKPVSGLRAALKAAPKLAVPGLAVIVVFVLGCKLLRLSEFDEMVAQALEKSRSLKKWMDRIASLVATWLNARTRR